MRTAGIICECDPPHAGHAYLIGQARQKCDAVVCLMSGCFVQRGDAAVLSPHARARMLLRMGADLVLELPFPWAASGAETFADAGVSILARLGIDELWFGSESGDLAALSALADAARSEAFRAFYAGRNRSSSDGTAALYRESLAAFCGCGTTIPPNDLLGVSYLRAIGEQSSSMTPVTVRRVGSGYADGALPAGGFASATALRNVLFCDGYEKIAPFLPEGIRDLLAAECAAGRAPASLERASSALLTFLRLCDPGVFARCAESSGGVGMRLKKIAGEVAGLSDLFARASTKKYPDARLRRALLFSLLGVTRDDLRTPPAYVRPLAFDRTGADLLAAVRGTSRVAVAMTRGAIPRQSAAARQKELGDRAESLYACCLPCPASPAELARRVPCPDV